jgi:hypothetical protein
MNRRRRLFRIAGKFVRLSPTVDTYANRGAPNGNYSSLSTIQVRGLGSAVANTGLLLFDLSAVTGITTASLRLVTAAAAPASDVTVTIHRVLAAAVWTAAATWNSPNGDATRWPGDAGGDGGADAGCSQAGIDYAAAPLGSFTITTSDDDKTVFTPVLDPAGMNAMLAANYGLVLISDNDAVYMSLGSRENTNVARRPLLTLV